MSDSNNMIVKTQDVSLESALNAAESYMNPELPVGERVEYLLSLMTVEEKVNQLTSAYVKTDQKSNAPGDLSGEFKWRLEAGLGSIQFVNLPHDAGQSALLANAIQSHILDKSRRGIPALLVGEACHGLIANKATSFPQAIALASTWDTELVERVYTCASQEARSRGNHLMNTPVLDLARDPRWGRMEETYGEDVYLVTRMGLAAVRGLQGVGETVDTGRVVSALKHLAGYGQCDGGRNFAPTNIPKRIFMEEVLEPFRQVLAKAHAWGVMPSHSEVDGVPAHGDKWLLDDLLRKEWGFKGVVVADYHDVHRLDILHRVAASQEEAALQALRAGVTLDFPDGASYSTLIQSLENHPEYLSDLDKRVREVLHLKFMLGLFENPYVEVEQATAVQNDTANKALALEAAEKAVILLKNNANILPLDKSKLSSVAVIGPNAEETILGGYSHWLTEGQSIIDGMRDYLADSDVEVLFSKGCAITAGGKTFAQLETGTEENTPVETIPYEVEKDSIAAAAEMAKACDVAVVCVGDDYFSTREAFYIKETLGDRASIDMVGNQEALIKAVIETGTPTIVVLIHGRSISINYTNEHADAILDGWYLGEETAMAVCRTLFGDNNPGGKLTVTVPRSAAHVPCHYSQRHSANWKGYLVEDNSRLYSFGYGLSYTTFQLDQISLCRSVIQSGETCEVSLDITNTGDRDGDEVVQVYIRDVVGSTSRPDLVLKAFERVSLESGETKHITLTLEAEAFEMIDLDYERVIEPGAFKILVGTSSRAEDLVELDLMIE